MGSSQHLPSCPVVQFHPFYRKEKKGDGTGKTAMHGLIWGISGKKTLTPEHSAFDHWPTSAQKLLQSDVPSGDTESLTSGTKTREATAGQLQLQPGSGPHLASHREREGHRACPALGKLRVQPTPTEGQKRPGPGALSSYKRLVGAGQ